MGKVGMICGWQSEYKCILRYIDWRKRARYSRLNYLERGRITTTMPIRRVSQKDAIEVYTATMAYLHDARYDSAAVIQTKYVKEMATGVFYFWERSRQHMRNEQTTPIAI